MSASDRRQPRFGSAGNGETFYSRGYTTTLDICQWLLENGLSAYEYQCTRGVKITPVFANALGEQARRYDIALSIHAPYYISLGSPDPVLQEKSKQHILRSLRAARWMGAGRVVLHLGGECRQPRAEALARVDRLLEASLLQAESEGLLTEAVLCPETMGKPGQLGHLGEVLRLCQRFPVLFPAVDFAHIHALTHGGLSSRQAFQGVLEQIEAKLGRRTVEELHVHFSPVEYGKTGEIRHRCLREKEYGPDFYHLARIIQEEKLRPTIICESAGSQVEDAVAFQEMYQHLAAEQNGQ